MSTNYTLTTSAATYTEVLTSEDGPARISAINGHVEWRVGTSAPSSGLAGEPLKGTIYDDDETETLPGDVLDIQESLLSGTSLYMKSVSSQVEVTVTTYAELYGA